MRKPVIWVEKDADRVKNEIRVSFSGARSMRWQSKRADSAVWVYDFAPTLGQWEFLASKIEDRYRRRAATWDDVLRIRDRLNEARQNATPRQGEMEK